MASVKEKNKRILVFSPSAYGILSLPLLYALKGLPVWADSSKPVFYNLGRFQTI
jgi:hypothetical protein